ncbi:hypothetical protein J2X69_001401 [Algoriphagus sp. 4150]|uniref:hypothetical protein n=1 Tax=Algoriphagus sp. 4150 TaxID=2817756 RepID=UPI0028603F9A|nr:hypothetical protein [Algoriphagus sp. 4150]MDR7129066.1 hypothetical protein [Algoriphagus sp. 4150]
MRILLLLVFYSLSLFLISYFLLDVEGMVLNAFAEQTEMEIPENVLLDALEDMRYWNKFSVLFTFLLLLVKCCLIALILYAGLFFANLHKGANLAGLFKVAVFAESILVIAGLVKVVIVSAGDFTYNEFAVFYPLSVLGLFDLGELNSLLIYPLQLVNLFELAYCFLLVYFFKQEVVLPWGDSAKVVLTSYLFTLIFWLVLILFLTLNFT